MQLGCKLTVSLLQTGKDWHWWSHFLAKMENAGPVKWIYSRQHKFSKQYFSELFFFAGNLIADKN